MTKDAHVGNDDAQFVAAYGVFADATAFEDVQAMPAYGGFVDGGVVAAYGVVVNPDSGELNPRDDGGAVAAYGVAVHPDGGT